MYIYTDEMLRERERETDRQTETTGMDLDSLKKKKKKENSVQQCWQRLSSKKTQTLEPRKKWHH